MDRRLPHLRGLPHLPGLQQLPTYLQQLFICRVLCLCILAGFYFYFIFFLEACGSAISTRITAVENFSAFSATLLCQNS